ncbi:MAG TPA: hypothetical protein DD414_08430 [Lachnospiraceae bacterium]|nr:hypothetical protein [Lachnospiraceae bacterium]
MNFDEAILPKELQAAKAFLPFLPANIQEMAAICIKWVELRLTIEYFSKNPPVQQSLEPGNIMKCLKGILPAEEQASFEQFADMFENMDMYREMFEGFSSSFTPGQKEDDT